MPIKRHNAPENVAIRGLVMVGASFSVPHHFMGGDRAQTQSWQQVNDML